MSKAIKVDEKVYEQLTRLLQPRETYSQVVGRLLALQEGVKQFITEVELLPDYRKYMIDRPEMGAKEGG
jgi:predicted CopG family antitoxin